ncbi:MAG: hypothetical protein NTV49_13830 [Kiritimatiellaeota bacterium]|nr:hypothetical protein [Kiritimatiellota bacterium]
MNNHYAQARSAGSYKGCTAYRNFLECVLARKTPASDIASAVQSDLMTHLGDIAVRTGRTIRWDAQRETIVGDETAQRMLRRAMREPWSL